MVFCYSKRGCTREEYDSSLKDVEKQDKLSSPVVPNEEGKQKRIKAATSTSSPKSYMKRKRGRAAASTRANKRPVQRTRTRIGSKPAKIDEIEASSSSDHDNDDDRKNITKQEPETKRENHKVDRALDDNTEIQERAMVEKNDSNNINNNSNNVDGNVGQLQVMVDPFEALLMDMIPSLGTKKKVDTSADLVPPPVLESKKMMPPPVDPEEEPMKKKKVSYKEVADELLRDY